MSENQPKARPWHGHASPFDALHDWMVKELAALEQRLKNPGIQAPATTASPPKIEPQKPAETVAVPHASTPAAAPETKPADA